MTDTDCLRLLRIFDSLCVSQAVWRETVEQKRISQNVLSEQTNIQRFSLEESEVAQFIKANNLRGLHAGEQECLCLCMRKGISTLLTDDMAVRDAESGLSPESVKASFLVLVCAGIDCRKQLKAETGKFVILGPLLAANRYRKQP